MQRDGAQRRLDMQFDDRRETLECSSLSPRLERADQPVIEEGTERLRLRGDEQTARVVVPGIEQLLVDLFLSRPEVGFPLALATSQPSVSRASQRPSFLS